MQVFAIILAIQIIVGGLILHTSSNSLSAKIVRHSIRQVLGTSFLAQNDSSSTTDQPTDTPTPDQSNQDVSSPTDTPTPDQTQPTDTPEPTTISPDTSTPSPTTDEQNTPSPTDANTQSGQENVGQSSDTTSSAPSDPLFFNTPESNSVIMNPLDIFTNAENISQRSLDNAQKQDEAVLAATTPQDKTTILISSTQNNIQGMTNTIGSQDFTTTAFLIQRIDNHLQETQQISQFAPQADQNQLRQETRKFCESADLVLKTQQLQVPEDLEQDVEIARGTCLNIQQ